MRILLVFVVFGGSLFADQKEPAVVRAAGEAAVSVPAGQSRLRIGVVSTAGNPQRAAAKNAGRINQVISQLHDLLGPDPEISTEKYSLERSYADGYSVTSIVKVPVRDPATAGKVIDIAAKFGANVIGLEASPLGEQEARSRAVRMASERAQANAEAIAAGLGLRVTRVVSAETSDLPLPVAPKMDVKRKVGKSNACTTVQAATVDINVRVMVTVEVAPLAERIT